MSKPLVSDIVKYFEDSLTNGNVGSDDKESLELAIDTIKEVFGVEAGSNDLLSLYEKGKSSDSAGPSVTSPTANDGLRAQEQKPISEETKKEAEEKKVAGNREMAQKNYEKAIDLYTEAITLNPENPLYFSNRAAAYSQASKPSLAVSDARRAISLDPSYSKAYSRLGLALYTLGDTQGALHAYEQGIKAEGDAPSEGMKRGYETVKSRIENENKELSTKDIGSEGASPAPTDSFSGMPGLGGGLGGLGGLGDLLNNPEIKNMASKMMSNPSMMANLMNSPAAKSIQNQFGGAGAGAGAGGNGGGMPDFSKLMNDPNISKMMNDPMIQNMAKQFMGGDN